MSLIIPQNILLDINNAEMTNELSNFLEEKENFLDIYDYCMMTNDGVLFENLITLLLKRDNSYSIELSLQDILMYFSNNRKEKLLFDFIPSLLEKWDEQPLPYISEDEKKLLCMDDNFDFDIDYYENRYVHSSGGLTPPKLSDYYSILEKCLGDENNEDVVPSHFMEKCKSLKRECLEAEEIDEY